VATIGRTLARDMIAGRMKRHMVRLIFSAAVVWGSCWESAVAAVQDRPAVVAQQTADQTVGDLPVRFNVITLSSYAIASQVTFKMFLKNVSSADLQLEVLRNIPSQDFEITDADGKVVWNSEAHSTIVQLAMNQSVTLEAGRFWEFRVEWDQTDNQGIPLPRGTYSVRARMEVNEHSIYSTKRTFSIL
jgi:hypothetical protein